MNEDGGLDTVELEGLGKQTAHQTDTHGDEREDGLEETDDARRTTSRATLSSLFPFQTTSISASTPYTTSSRTKSI